VLPHRVAVGGFGDVLRWTLHVRPKFSFEFLFDMLLPIKHDLDDIVL
jgi:hypothetical protein